jgi:hypothetical protein
MGTDILSHKNKAGTRTNTSPRIWPGAGASARTGKTPITSTSTNSYVDRQSKL